MDINEILEVTEITELGFSFKFRFRFRCVVVDVQALTLSMCRARYSAQRQLRSGFLFAGSWLVSYSPVFMENRAQDFSDFLHEGSLL